MLGYGGDLHSFLVRFSTNQMRPPPPLPFAGSAHFQTLVQTQQNATKQCFYNVHDFLFCFVFWVSLFLSSSIPPSQKKPPNYYFGFVVFQTDGWLELSLNNVKSSSILREGAGVSTAKDLKYHHDGIGKDRPPTCFFMGGGRNKSTTQGFLNANKISQSTRKLLRRIVFTRPPGWRPGFILVVLFIRHTLSDVFFSFLCLDLFLCSVSCRWTIYFGFTRLEDLHHGSSCGSPSQVKGLFSLALFFSSGFAE